MNIDWSTPSIGNEEKQAVDRVMDSGWLTQGPETKSFERELGAFVGNRFCTVVNNGTSALITALLAHDIKPGDEVIVPAHTFIAPINTILLIGAKPVLADVDPNTWNLTAESAKDKITNRTKAILPVNVAGMPVDIYPFQELCSKNNLPLIIDAAESIGAEYRHRLLGDAHFEHTAIFSFHIAKQMSTVEGGCIFTDKKDIHEKCRMIRSHGENGRYTYYGLGLNFRTTDIQSAIGREQLKKLPGALRHRHQCVSLYKQYLRDKFLYQEIPEYVTRHPHLFFGILSKERKKILSKLNTAEIDTRICWPYICNQPFHKDIFEDKYPISRKLSSEILTLPLSNLIPFEDVKKVCNIINKDAN